MKACVSASTWLPSATVDLDPVGASVRSTATARSVCNGTMTLVDEGVVVEVFSLSTRIAYKVCPDSTSCSVDVPSGYGQVRVLGSSFWEVPASATWLTANTPNNDGYCNFGATQAIMVCRSWATGIS